MERQRIQISPEIVEKNVASEDDKATKDKMFIYYTLLHTVPDMNKNGVSYDFSRTQEVHDSILNGYINFEHDAILNIGTVIESNFVEEGEGASIENKAVLWKSVLQELGIQVEDITAGRYQMSMEVLYKDYYYMVGDERVEAEGNEYLEDYKGSTYEGKVVKKVLYPHEFTGAALTSNAADNKADIFKAVASKYQNKGGQDDMFKQLEFETEEAYNEYLEELKEDIREDMREELAEEIKNDEDFVTDLREGYVEVAEVVSKFEDLEIAEAESLEDIVGEVKEIADNYKNLQDQVKKQKVLNERASELAEFDFDISDLEEDKKEIAEMSDAQFNLLKKTIKSSFEKAQASMEKNKGDKKNDKFDPNLNLEDDNDVSRLDIINSL